MFLRAEPPDHLIRCHRNAVPHLRLAVQNVGHHGACGVLIEDRFDIASELVLDFGIVKWVVGIAAGVSDFSACCSAV
jgi:hypothetical protein